MAAQANGQCLIGQAESLDDHGDGFRARNEVAEGDFIDRLLSGMLISDHAEACSLTGELHRDFAGYAHAGPVFRLVDFDNYF